MMDYINLKRRRTLLMDVQLSIVIASKYINI